MEHNLTRDEVLAVEDRVGEWVECPKWGGRLFVVPMSGKSRDAWDQTLLSINQGRVGINAVNVRARVVSLCVVDPDTLRPLFSLEDTERLGEKDGATLSAIADVAERLSGLDSQAIATLTTLLKNVLSSSSGEG
jgi:hypothetical protein